MCTFAGMELIFEEDRLKMLGHEFSLDHPISIMVSPQQGLIQSFSRLGTDEIRYRRLEIVNAPVDP